MGLSRFEVLLVVCFAFTTWLAVMWIAAELVDIRKLLTKLVEAKGIETAGSRERAWAKLAQVMDETTSPEEKERQELSEAIKRAEDNQGKIRPH